MQKTNSAALSRFDWFDSQRLAFVVFFLIGAISVISLKEHGISPFITIACSLFVMLLYIVYSGTRPYSIRADIIGDNIYYLGFLFTLVSLAYTLYRFTSADAEIDEIIKNFGIALSTTLIGVVGRVYFNQTHDDGDDAKADGIVDTDDLLDQERLLHASLSDRTSHLISEIDVIQEQLIKLKNNTLESVQKTTEGSMAGFVQNLEKIMSLHEQHLEKDREHQVAMQDAFSQSVESSSSALNALTDKVRQSTQLISEDVQASLHHYSKLSKDIEQEAKASLGLINALQSGLARLGNFGRSDSSDKN